MNDTKALTPTLRIYSVGRRGGGMLGIHRYKGTSVEYCAVYFLTDKKSTKGFSVGKNLQK